MSHPLEPLDVLFTVDRAQRSWIPRVLVASCAVLVAGGLLAGAFVEIDVTVPGRIVLRGSGGPGAPLVAEASVPASQVDRAMTARAVRIGLDAYPPAEFGWCRGEVKKGWQPGAEPEEPNRYRVPLDVSGWPRDEQGQPVRLWEGMTGQAAFVVGRESLIHFFLRPSAATAESGLDPVR